MYSQLLKDLKEDLKNLKMNDENIFTLVSIGGIKTDGSPAIASIFLSDVNHTQKTNFRYEITPSFDIVLIFNKNRNENNFEEFTEKRFNMIEVVEEYIKSKKNGILNKTELAMDNNTLYAMLSFNLSEVKSL